MIELVRDIQSISDDIVFVGGVSEVLQGVRTETNDIDIVVKSLKGFEKFGEIREFISNNEYRFGCKRALIKGEYTIDIWIKDELPEYIIIDNIKVKTLKSMIMVYEEELLVTVRDYSRNRLVDKIDRLKKYIRKDD